MKLTKLICVAVLSAVCLSTISACSKSDQAAADLAYLRKQKEKEVADKKAAEAKFIAEQERTRKYNATHPLP